MFQFLKNLFRFVVRFFFKPSPIVANEPPQQEPKAEAPPKPPQEPPKLIIRQDEQGRHLVNGEYRSFEVSSISTPRGPFRWALKSHHTLETFDAVDIEMGELKILTQGEINLVTYKGQPIPCFSVRVEHLEESVITAELKFHIEFDGKYKAAVKSEYKEWPSPS